jgi:DNA-binding MarR family transcriptional regulator
VEGPERGELGAGAPASEIAARAWRLLRDLLEAQHARWRRGLAERGLTVVQANALMVMAEMPPGPMTRLADRLGVDPSWVTGLVDRLQTRGEVARRPSPDDRRIKIVELTGAGQETSQALLRLRNEPPRELLELPEADLRELLRIVGEVLRLRRRQQPSS